MKFILKYFMNIDPLINGILKIVSFDCSLVVYRNSFANSFVLTATLVDFILFSVYMITMFAVNKDSFISSFSIWTPFISFPWLTEMTRSSMTMLNRVV